MAGPSHHIQEQIVRRQRPPPPAQQQQQQQQQPTATKKPESQQPPSSSQQQIQVREELGKAFGNSSSLNSLIYPQALVNLPQEVLMNLVQSGHLQVEEEGNVTHFIYILVCCFTFFLVLKKEKKVTIFDFDAIPLIHFDSFNGSVTIFAERNKNWPDRLSGMDLFLHINTLSIEFCQSVDFATPSRLHSF